MKYLLFLLSLLFFVSCKKDVPQFKRAPHIASKVDGLNNAHDVEAYLHTVDTNFKDIKLLMFKDFHSRYNTLSDTLIKTWAKQYNVNKSYYKEDFDDNGYTDLLVIADNHYCEEDSLTCDFASFVLMNFGNDSIQIKNIVKQWNSAIVPQVKTDKEGVNLIVHSINPFFEKKETKHKISKLIYKYDNFIEYNSNYLGNHIEKIQFAASPCYGTCPSFEIVVDKNASALFIAKSNNFTKSRKMLAKEEGVFKTKLNAESFNQLMGLANYLDLKKLDNEYAVPWTDSASAMIKITYLDGSVKIIDDYGLSGTYGLKALYDIFHELRFNQSWVPTTEPKGIRLSTY